MIDMMLRIKCINKVDISNFIVKLELKERRKLILSEASVCSVSLSIQANAVSVSKGRLVTKVILYTRDPVSVVSTSQHRYNSQQSATAHNTL